MKAFIAVSATALDKGGALTILIQFLKYASQDTENHYVCFVSKGLDLGQYDNISLIEVDKMGWFKRIAWDAYYFKSEISKIQGEVVKAISLQNTSLNVTCEQVVYLHQSLPFTDVRLSLLKREQFKLCLYKYFYVFFINLFVDDETKFFVQTNWMRKSLHKKCNIKNSNIYVVRPDIALSVPECNDSSTSKTGVHKLIYPATPLFYKNHIVILKALQILKLNKGLGATLFQVTFDHGDCPKFDRYVNDFCLSANVEYLGIIPHSELLRKYMESTLVLFPSFIETFGLPLAEGAAFKKPILCSDLPYSREVLSGYPGASFIKYDEAQDWADGISKSLLDFESNSLNSNLWSFSYKTSWEDFFKLI